MAPRSWDIILRSIGSLLLGRSEGTPPFPRWRTVRSGVLLAAFALLLLWVRVCADNRGLGLIESLGRIVLGLFALLLLGSLLSWFDFAYALHRREYGAALTAGLRNALLALLPTIAVVEALLKGRAQTLALWFAPPALLTMASPLWPLYHIARGPAAPRSVREQPAPAPPKSPKEEPRP